MINDPVIMHCGVALAVSSIVAFLGYPAIGFWIVSTFYYSRELNQYQTKLAKDKGVFRSTLWNVWWPKGHEKEFVIPSLISLVVALMWNL